MNKFRVAITPYRSKIKSVKKAIELSDAFKNLSGNEKVFLKPNIVYWFTDPLYPKYGIVTTSRVVEDTIIALKERGIKDITIGESPVPLNPNDFKTMHHAFETLGYNKFKKRYDVKLLNILEGSFEKIDLGDGIELNFNTDFLYCDHIISLPVLKTHSQVKVSLSIKNLKGLIDINSRKKCHSPDKEKDLEVYISRLPKHLPPTSTIIDGIYTNEMGPGFEGKVRRKNILIASSDLFSADKVGAKILGYDPSKIPYFVHYAKNNNRPIDFSDVEIVGRKIERAQDFHEYKFPFTEGGLNPLAYEKMGIKGISYRQYDDTICTFCTIITSAVMTAIGLAWNGDPWDDIEVLSGKRMEPTPGRKKTILLGQCMCNKHRNNPDIDEMIPIKGCPAKIENVINALYKAGIDINPDVIKNYDKIAGLKGLFYKHRFNEFDESFFIEDVEPVNAPPLDNIGACQFYFDNDKDSAQVPKKQAKFEVKFFGLIGEKNTNLIKNIIIEGPNGYEFKFENQRFDFMNGNGYIVDNMYYGLIKYLAFDKNGFLEDGKYTFTIEYWNNDIKKRSRILKTSDRLLKDYLAVKDKIIFSHEKKPAYKDDPRIFISTQWTTLKELGGIDAYYANRVSEGNTTYINLHDLTFYDDISMLSQLMPSYGLNNGSALANTRWRPIKSNTEYTWLTEICDSNKLNDLNISIFQPHQHLITP